VLGRNAGGKPSKVLPSFQCRTSSSVAAFAEVVSTGVLLLCGLPVYVRARGAADGMAVFDWQI
jgi:hypothetical protein